VIPFIRIIKALNLPYHSYQQAAHELVAKLLSRGPIPKQKNKQSALVLPLTKISQQAYLWLGGKMVSSGLCWIGLFDFACLAKLLRKRDTTNPLSTHHAFDKCFAIE
jgi:hypothetical protein